MTDEVKPPTPAGPDGAPHAGAPPAEFPLDLSKLSEAYANFCRVIPLPEEIVLDFGLNTQVAPNPADPIKVTHRLVLNYYTAKRLLLLLHMWVQKYESIFGVLETDVNKRQRPLMRPPAGGPGQQGIRPS
jgi:hypothetical protein